MIESAKSLPVVVPYRTWIFSVQIEVFTVERGECTFKKEKVYKSCGSYSRDAIEV